MIIAYNKFMSKISENRVLEVRTFNRFITRKIGVLREGLLKSPFSLTEVRLLFELANGENLTASHLSGKLGVDAGYLSRTLAKLEAQKLIEKVRAETDGRHRILQLTKAGEKTFQTLDKRSHDEVAKMLEALSEEDQKRLLSAMETIVKTLEPQRKKSTEPFILRPHEPGDMGWVIFRNAVVYAEEYKWDERYEALVANICADFVNNFDSKKERCWIAEMDGERVGSVFLVKGDDEKIAKLRLLIVGPKARGFGLGSRLVDECIRFARRSGYEKMTLWTNSILLAARHIYQKAGFQVVREEKHHSFGQDLVGETWELNLTK
jgi:DNA-binding MarR family transcriptional regulator/GNAT superfamily N-acetyltransferase